MTLATIDIERQASTDETRTSAYDVGRWCFANDAECPYTRDHDVQEWYAGWLDASSALIERMSR